MLTAGGLAHYSPAAASILLISTYRKTKNTTNDFTQYKTVFTMKKSYYSILLFLAFTLISHNLSGQEENVISITPETSNKEPTKDKKYFTFVKSTISRIEYLSSVTNTYEFGSPELKKRMLGIFPIEQIDSEINYDDKGYLKFSAIPLNEVFLMITNEEGSGYKNYEENLIIQNVKTKKMFAVSYFAMRTFQDYSNMGNDNNGNGWLTKLVPKELSASEKELIKRFKTLIKNGEEKTKTLNSIEKRHLTLTGYFDASNVKSIDRLLYNKTIDELSVIYKKLYDIYLYEDKNSKAELSLSISELASYYSVKKWYNTARKIN